MNIFALDYNTQKAAKWHVDRHAVKMILESAQLLCISHVQTNSYYTPKYKGNGFRNHPCAIWTRASTGNYKWLCELGLELCKEYTYRYGKVHATQNVLLDLKNHVPWNIPSKGLTSFALAMPDNCKVQGNPIQSYRNYYVQEKRHLAKWSKRAIPPWFV